MKLIQGQSLGFLKQDGLFTIISKLLLRGGGGGGGAGEYLYPITFKIKCTLFNS